LNPSMNRQSDGCTIVRGHAVACNLCVQPVAFVAGSLYFTTVLYHLRFSLYKALCRRLCFLATSGKRRS
jgi:hypothetical protein